MTGTYDIHLVALSVAIAILVSYTALDLAGRVTAAQGRLRGVWLAGGAVVMGIGIWSMHFIGMLSFHLSMPIAYDVPTVLVSLLVAIGASALALFVVSLPSMSRGPWLLAGTVMGAGIAAMHYSGMAALRLDVSYEPLLFALSLLIAVGASLAALWLAFRLRRQRRARYALRLGSAMVMGAAIAGMHYTGMAAARFTMPAGAGAAPSSAELAAPLLGASIGIATLVVLGFALLTSLVDQRMAAQMAEAEALRHSEERLRVVGKQLQQQLDVTRAITDSLGEGVCALDHDGNVTFMNPAAEVLLGWRETDLCGTPLHAALHAHHHGEPGEDDLLHALIQVGGGVRDAEDLFTRRGGTVFPAAYTVSPIIGEQGVTGVVVSFQDSTARRQAQQGLESENRRLQQVVTNAPVAMAMLDTEMRYLAYSERWVTDYAIAAGEIAVGRSHYAVNPHIPEHWKANHRRALAGEALFNAEEPWLHPDGSRHYIRWAINPWYEAGGTVGGIIILTILVDGHDP